jgi:AcrR family transcriptional regulator
VPQPCAARSKRTRRIPRLVGSAGTRPSFPEGRARGASICIAPTRKVRGVAVIGDAHAGDLWPGVASAPARGVTEIQRGRMIAAAVQTVGDVGYAGMSVAQIIRRARVSRKTFYGLFANREECFLAAFDHAVYEAERVAADAFKNGSGWPDGVRCGLAALLAFMDERPDLARLCLLDALGTGNLVLRRRAEVLEELASVLDVGRSRTQRSREPPPLAAETIVGGVFAVVHARLLNEEHEPLSGLLGDLMSMIVLPYLGAAGARRELSRQLVPAADRPRSRRRPKKADPLHGLSMRLTYRTVLVLMYLAEHPGASNRQVADGSQIVDQGQISKLLGRLARLGLAENRGGGQQRGAANAWRLTRHGAQLERAARPLR